MKTKNGFTIIELIVVIAIIAVLASIVTVSLTKYIGSSKIARANEDVKNIEKALIMFYAEYGDYPYYGGIFYYCPDPFCDVGFSSGSPVHPDPYDPYLTVDEVPHYLSEFYKLPSADYFTSNGYYFVRLFDSDGDSKIGCGTIVIGDESHSYGQKRILCQDCDCSPLYDLPFRMEPYY